MLYRRAMSDDVPNYPPGPRGPEDPEPGVRLDLTAGQVIFIGRYIATVDRASGVRIEDRGAGYFHLTVTDPYGAVIDEYPVFPTGNKIEP